MEFYDFDDGYLERLRAGDYRTQEHFVVYFTEFLQIKLRFRRLPPDEIEDVRQTTFARFFVQLRKENHIRDGKRLGSYVNSICLNVLRERGRPRPVEQADEHQTQNIPDPGLSAEDIVGNQEQRRMVREILNSLPKRDREILGDLFLRELDKDAICRKHKITRANLRVVVLRAKEKFRAQIRKRPPGPRGKAAD